MRFQPKSAAEIQAESNSRNSNALWPRGTYDFEVVNATDEVSKAGNEMIKLQLRVYDAAGNTQMVWDYLLESIAEKLMHACEAFGLTSNYDVGELEASDFEGKAGQVILYIQKGKDGYADKNAVADYVRRKTPATMPLFNGGGTPKGKPIAAGAGSDLNDDIPFGPCWQ